MGSNPTLSAIHAPVAQLDRASDYGSEGREFESLRARHVKIGIRAGCRFLLTGFCSLTTAMFRGRALIHTSKRGDSLNLDEQYMRQALQLAEAACQKGEVPVGALLVGEAGVISCAHNRCEELHDATAHAELLVLQEGGRCLGSWRLLNTTLYVTLEPCPMCAGALVHARVSRLVFGTRDPKGGAAGSLYNIPADPRLNHRLEVHEGVLAQECAALLKDFFRERRGQ